MGKTILWKNYIMEKNIIMGKTIVWKKNYGTMPNTIEL